LCIAELTFDLQPFLRENLAPSLTDKKRDISSTLGKAAAKITAGTAGSEHQDPGPAHVLLLIPALARP
jgi:hypothetical protein